MEMKEKRLLAYTAAAGLGAFAFGQIAQAEVVYVDLPDQTLDVRSNPSYGGEEILIDIDGDSDIDFKVQFVDFGSQYASVRGRSMDYNLSLTNTAKGNTYYIRSFDVGDMIGWGNPDLGNCTGPGEIIKPTGLYPAGFGRDVPSFMGIALHEDGSNDYYFGWIRLQTTMDYTVNLPYGLPTSVTVYDFAYETTPNTDIECFIPEPGALSLLAVGFGAMGLRRRA